MEITLSPAMVTPEAQEIYLDGAVTYPGIYSFRENDSIEDILQNAGGRTLDADPAKLEIYVPYSSESLQPQKVNINRAEAWLLVALDDIGKVRADAIIQYRDEHGDFEQVDDLKKVPGIGEAIFEKNKDKITVVG